LIIAKRLSWASSRVWSLGTFPFFPLVWSDASAGLGLAVSAISCSPLRLFRAFASLQLLCFFFSGLCFDAHLAQVLGPSHLSLLFSSGLILFFFSSFSSSRTGVIGSGFGGSRVLAFRIVIRDDPYQPT
jgi:hypothetical protein